MCRYLPPGTELDVDVNKLFEGVVAAMALVGFTAEEEASIWTVLAGILQLGETKFVGSSQVPTQLLSCLLIVTCVKSG
jgi:myosin heavy subunit